MNEILAVVDWIENTLISILVNLAGAGLRIHNEFCSAPYYFRIYIQLFYNGYVIFALARYILVLHFS